jgi:hypothetical protein
VQVVPAQFDYLFELSKTDKSTLLVSDQQEPWASEATNEIGWNFITNYQYVETNPPSIFNSQGQGWGSDGCTCTYSGYY